MNKSENEKYQVWFYDFKDLRWQGLPVKGSFEAAMKDLKGQLQLTVRQGWKKSLFKISKYGDTEWQKHIPSYLYKK